MNLTPQLTVHLPLTAPILYLAALPYTDPAPPLYSFFIKDFTKYGSFQTWLVFLSQIIINGSAESQISHVCFWLNARLKLSTFELRRAK